MRKMNELLNGLLINYEIKRNDEERFTDYFFKIGTKNWMIRDFDFGAFVADFQTDKIILAPDILSRDFECTKLLRTLQRQIKDTKLKK